MTRAQLERFSAELFKVVPRRLLPTRQGRPGGAGAPQTIGERLTMLTTLHGSWRRAAAIVLGEAVEGCRNDTAWAVVASAAGRGIPEDVVWELFEKHFNGGAEVSEAQVASMIERARPVLPAVHDDFSLVRRWRHGGRDNPSFHTHLDTVPSCAHEMIPVSRRRRVGPKRRRYDCEVAGRVRHSQPDAGAGAVSRIDLRWRQPHGPRQDRGRHHRRLRCRTRREARAG